MMTNTMTAKVSAQVLTLINQGVDPIVALKMVCGAETVDAMIDALYRELRSRG